MDPEMAAKIGVIVDRGAAAMRDMPMVAVSEADLRALSSMAFIGAIAAPLYAQEALAEDLRASGERLVREAVENLAAKTKPGLVTISLLCASTLQAIQDRYSVYCLSAQGAGGAGS